MKIGTKHSMLNGIKFFSNEWPRARPFPRGYYKIAKIHWRNFKIFSSRTTKPITIKLDTKHSWMKRIKICSFEGWRPFLRGDNYIKVKIHWRNLKVFFSRNIGSIITKTWHKASLSEGVSRFTTKDHLIIKKPLTFIWLIPANTV